MGILQLYPPNEFFEAAGMKEFRQGQFCWIPTPHIDPVPRILDVERSGPEEHEEVSFIIRNANRPKDFHTRDRTLPIKYLNLRSHEELLLQRAKKRPGIILASEIDKFPELDKLLKQKGKKHLQDEAIFVIPGYNIEKESGGTGFPLEMVARIRCLLYRQFFYFPLKTPHFTEGIARFDRIQVIVGRDHSAINPVEVALSKDVFSLFFAMFLYCISGEESQELKDIRDIVKDAFPEEL
ncbi:MAG: hypothetical protein QME75_14550 [Deltaproteobacteria bacterium]|nr:hypothetical protein [Deltaproteobacteria bacterium]